MDHGIPFGIFQICKEESQTSAGPALRRVATSLGKRLEISESEPIVPFMFAEPRLVSGCRGGV